VDSQWCIQRQGIAGTAVISIGCDDDNFRYLGKRVCEQCNTGGQIAIIVADQNFHNMSMRELISLS
jgi:hypothetical protein